MAKVKYIASLTGVREVSLIAKADLGYWQRHLAAAGLYPFAIEGHAQVIISAMSSRWMGVRFRELIIALPVSTRSDGTSRDDMYLVTAFNSSRLFTFFERVSFQTPYQHAALDVQVDTPTSYASFQLRDSGELLMEAAMSKSARTAREVDEHWEGTIHLPQRAAAANRPRKLFYARIAGRTEQFPFDAASDVATLNFANAHPVLQYLRESNFTPTEWHVRPAAAHARSKTFDRPM